MNITLIGMPASGKSTVGVLLAKRLGMEFLDTDLLIQRQEERLLKDIIAEEGLAAFLGIENQVNREVEAENTVIAPGGSCIYGEEAMEHFRDISTVVFLKVPYEQLAFRLGNLKERGVALKEGQTLRDLYEERTPLYEKYAHITIEEDGYDIGPVVDQLKKMFGQQVKNDRNVKRFFQNK